MVSKIRRIIHVSREFIIKDEFMRAWFQTAVSTTIAVSIILLVLHYG